MNLGEFPEGLYRLRQNIDEDGSTSTTLFPVRERWRHVACVVPDSENAELLAEMLEGERLGWADE